MWTFQSKLFLGILRESFEYIHKNYEKCSSESFKRFLAHFSEIITRYLGYSLRFYFGFVQILIKKKVRDVAKKLFESLLKFCKISFKILVIFLRILWEIRTDFLRNSNEFSFSSLQTLFNPLLYFRTANWTQEMESFCKQSLKFSWAVATPITQSASTIFLNILLIFCGW